MLYPYPTTEPCDALHTLLHVAMGDGTIPPDVAFHAWWEVAGYCAASCPCPAPTPPQASADPKGELVAILDAYDKRLPGAKMAIDWARLLALLVELIGALFPKPAPTP